MTDQICEDCRRHTNAAYQRVTDLRFVCFDCLQRTAPGQVAAYPGWLERERERQRKAEQDRKNFTR